MGICQSEAGFMEPGRVIHGGHLAGMVYCKHGNMQLIF
jgi:hypothetical protein